MIIQKQPVTSGKLVDWLKKALKDIAKYTENVINDVAKQTGSTIEDTQVKSDGSEIFTVFPEDKNLQPYLCKLGVPEVVDDNSYIRKLSFQDPSNKVYSNVLDVQYVRSEVDSNTAENEESIGTSEDNVEFVIQNLQDWVDIETKFQKQVMSRFPVSASIKLAVTKSIMAGSDIIELTGVDTNCSYNDTIEYIDDFFDAETISAEMPEDSCCYELLPDNDTIEITQIDEVSPTADAVLQQIVTEVLSLQTIVTAIKLSKQCDNSDVSICDTTWWATESLIEVLTKISQNCNYNSSLFLTPLQTYAAPILGTEVIPILHSHLQSIISLIDITTYLLDYAEFQSDLCAVKDQYISISDKIEDDYIIATDEYSF